MHEGWNDSVYVWIDSSEPGMKIDMIQPSVESIQCKLESFDGTIQTKTSPFKCESIQENVNRFIIGHIHWWVDSMYFESIQKAQDDWWVNN